jgi:hypothetical protein
LKINITGIVINAAIMIVLIPISSIGKNIEKINRTSVNPKRIAQKYKTKRTKMSVVKKVVPNKIKNHPVINKIKMINNRGFFDNFFKPEMNLIIFNLRFLIFLKLFN